MPGPLVASCYYNCFGIFELLHVCRWDSPLSLWHQMSFNLGEIHIAWYCQSECCDDCLCFAMANRPVLAEQLYLAGWTRGPLTGAFRNNGLIWWIAHFSPVVLVCSESEPRSFFRVPFQVRKNIVSYNIALSSCEKSSSWEMALCILESIPTLASPNEISYAAAITACGKGQQWRLALDMFESIAPLKERISCCLAPFDNGIFLCTLFLGQKATVA